MKGSKKKGRFMDIKEYEMKKNNKNNINSIKHCSNIKSHEEYETPLQTLQKLFPNFSEEIIESIYEENDRTFSKAKKYMEEICQEIQIENEADEEVEMNEEEEKKFDNTRPDLNSFTRFKYDGDDPFIDDLQGNTNSDSTIRIDNIKDYRKKKYKIDVNTLLSQQKKNAEEYVSVFENMTNELTPTNKKIELNYTENYLEELTLDYYCEIILEFFPNFSRLEIMQKICDYDFDIDQMVLALFDSKNDFMIAEEFNKLEISEISPEMKEEVISNFYSGSLIKNVNSNIESMEEAIFNHNLQNLIAKEIKKNTLNSKLSNNLFNENEFPFLSDKLKSDVMNSNQLSDEYFLDKKIKDIKTKVIKEDLFKLCKNFPVIEEFEIKWVYYQFMSYNETFKYFKNGKNTLKNVLFNGEDIKNNSKINSSKIEKQENKNSKINNRNEAKIESSSNVDNLPNLLCKLISENPNNWRIENNFKNINISDYQTIRKKLIWQAQLAWRAGKYQDAKVIMAKARRYKEEINTLLKNKKIELFLKNNERDLVINMINKRENFVDLHGLSYEESKMLIKKKISDIDRKRDSGLIDGSKKFCLNIITGLGKHSKDNKAILLPRISSLLKSMNYFVKIERDKGTIRLYL